MACRRIAVSIAFVLLALLGAQEAWAQPAEGAVATPRFTIARFEAHRKCPAQLFFRRTLEQTLGPASETAAREPMQVSIRITRRRGSFHLELSTKDGSGAGTRTLHAPSCKELLTTAAVIVGLAMQPDLLFENESEREVTTPASFGWQATDDETPRSIHRRDSPGPRFGDRDEDGGGVLKVSVGLAGIADVGTLPRAAIGLGVVASARADKHLLSFRLTQWATQREYVQSTFEDRGGNFDYISASLDLCRDLWQRRVSAGLCGALGLGRLKGESIVIDLPISQSHIMANAGAAAFARLDTGRASALRVQVELVANFVRPKYSVELLDEMDDTLPPIKRPIHTVSPMSVRLAASWGMRF